VARSTQAEAEQADNGTDQPLGLPVSQAEHCAQRERRQDGKQRIPGLPTARRSCLDRPRRDRFVGKPDHQAAALTQAGVVDRPVRHLALLPWNIVAAVLVQLEWHNGHPRARRGGDLLPIQLLSAELAILHHTSACFRVLYSTGTYRKPVYNYLLSQRIFCARLIIVFGRYK